MPGPGPQRATVARRAPRAPAPAAATPAPRLPRVAPLCAPAGATRARPAPPDPAPRPPRDYSARPSPASILADALLAASCNVLALK